MNEGVVVTNNEGYILYVNFKFSEIIGRSREALIDQKITAFVDDSNKRILKQGVESCQKHQKSTLEITWNKDNDEKIITCVSSRMIEDTCPKNNIYFAIITDITESKKVQKELILSEQKYNTVVENSLTGLYIEQNGKIVYSNPHFANIFGYKSTELRGKKTQELIQNGKQCQGAGAPCYLTTFWDSCHQHSFAYAANGRCPGRPASVSTTHKTLLR